MEWAEKALHVHHVCLPLFGGELALRPVPRSKEEADDYIADRVVSLYEASKTGDSEIWKDVTHRSVPSALFHILLAVKAPGG